MLFKQKDLIGITKGKISFAFRKWKNQRVKKGSLINTSIGRIEIIDIEEIDINSLRNVEVKKAGYKQKEDLLNILNKISEGKLYKIQLSFHSKDPRIALREKTKLNKKEIETLHAKLERLDKFSKQGKWALQVLELIRDNPKRRAGDLSELIGKEKAWLKLNIRKLKNLGLTISHGVGYEISPRGETLLKYLN